MLADLSSLTDDTVHPVQFFVPQKVSPSLLQLFQAMLDRAIRDIKQARIDGHRNINPDALTAWAWCQREDIDYPFSFLNVCHACGVPPSRLRTHLAPYWERITQKLQHAQASAAAQMYQRRRARIIKGLADLGPCHFHTLRNAACLSPEILRALLHDLIADQTVGRINAEKDSTGRRWYKYFLVDSSKSIKSAA